MKTSMVFPTRPQTQAEFEALIRDLRPELHRYVTRMIGSVVDGEDVVQEALVKAYYSLPSLSPDSNWRGWLFRIAHNKAIDYLRRANLQTMEQLNENLIIPEPKDLPLEKKELTKIALSVFLKLAPRQRSCVILKDVLGYSLAEISEFLNATVPEIKAVLHRGRSRLRELGKSIEKNIPILNNDEQRLLTRYADYFNTRDFDSVRRMLADEVRLDLVNKAKVSGANEISSNYFHNYKRLDDWLFKPGIVENRPAILVFDPNETSPDPSYFILLAWEGEQVSLIRDYRYARYVISEAETIVT